MTSRESRTVLITGVTRGLGRAMADRFREAGCRVLGCGRSSEKIAALSGEFGPLHRFSVVDISQEDQVSGWAESLLADGLVPDLLINNAALINRSAPLWEVPPAEFADLLNVNVLGTYLVIRAFVPSMIAREQGVIVNFSSGWGRSTSPEVAPYCTTKWAIEGMTQALAQELPRGLAAIPLNPGVINTDMLRRCFGASANSYPTAEEWARGAVPFILKLGPRHSGQAMTVP